MGCSSCKLETRHWLFIFFCFLMTRQYPGAQGLLLYCLIIHSERLIILPFSQQKRRLSILMFWSTHLNLHMTVCLDLMEQLFQLNVITKSKFILIQLCVCVCTVGGSYLSLFLHSAFVETETVLRKILTCNMLSSFQEVCCGWYFPASHLASFCVHGLSRRSDRF